MNLDPGVLCFTHCSRRIFCLTIPEVCPSCRMSIGDDIVPFRDFVEEDDLHIGVTSSNCVLYEFDARGLTQERASNTWEQSLVVYKETSPQYFSVWDSILEDTACDSIWTPEMYDETTCNCYDFVLAFLQNLNSSNFTQSKSGFIEKYISPEILKAFKYIQVYREIRANGCFVSDSETSP